MGARDAEAFFGTRPTAAHTSDARFHTRAHALLEKVHGAPDMHRAVTKVPRPAYRGHDFASMGNVLNKALLRMPEVGATKACSDFSSEELRDLLADQLFEAAAPALLEVYDGAVDNRRRIERSVGELRARWEEVCTIHGMV